MTNKHFGPESIDRKSSDYEYFPSDYSESRGSFLAYQGNNVVRKKYEIKAANQEGLYVDTYYEGAVNEKDNILIINSGTHGAEGRVGSAIQFMVLNEFRYRLSKNTGLLLVHAVNPFGYKNGRRVNENNIDLNRAFCDKSLIPNQPNEDQVFVNQMMQLFRKPIDRIVNNPFEGNELAKRFIETRGENAFMQAVAGGQYFFPGSLFYGGSKDSSPEQSVLIMDDIFKSFTQGYKRAIVYDVHSGLGEKNDLTAFTTGGVGGKEYLSFSDIFPNTTSTEQLDSKGIYSAIGTTKDCLKRLSCANETYAASVEFGTVPKDEMIGALILEHQAYFEGGDQEVVAQVKERLRNVFCPDDIIWMNGIIKTAREVMNRSLNVLQL